MCQWNNTLYHNEAFFIPSVTPLEKIAVLFSHQPYEQPDKLIWFPEGEKHLRVRFPGESNSIYCTVLPHRDYHPE